VPHRNEECSQPVALAHRERPRPIETKNAHQPWCAATRGPCGRRLLTNPSSPNVARPGAPPPLRRRMLTTVVVEGGCRRIDAPLGVGRKNEECSQPWCLEGGVVASMRAGDGGPRGEECSRPAALAGRPWRLCPSPAPRGGRKRGGLAGDGLAPRAPPSLETKNAHQPPKCGRPLLRDEAEADLDQLSSTGALGHRALGTIRTSPRRAAWRSSGAGWPNRRSPGPTGSA
jgi:hypothetical protein